MKWKTEIPNKGEFLKINTHSFIENERYNTEVEHERNVGKTTTAQSPAQGRSLEGYQTSSSVPINKDKEIHEQFTQSRVKEADEAIAETCTITDSRVDYTGPAPKRYTTRCFIKPTTVPSWYTESLLLKLGSTKRIYSEQIYFKKKFEPVHWAEMMSTEVKTSPQFISSEIIIPRNDISDDVHYISLEPQQIAATKTANLTEL